MLVGLCDVPIVGVGYLAQSLEAIDGGSQLVECFGAHLEDELAVQCSVGHIEGSRATGYRKRTTFYDLLYRMATTIDDRCPGLEATSQTEDSPYLSGEGMMRSPTLWAPKNTHFPQDFEVDAVRSTRFGSTKLCRPPTSTLRVSTSSTSFAPTSAYDASTVSQQSPGFARRLRNFSLRSHHIGRRSRQGSVRGRLTGALHGLQYDLRCGLSIRVGLALFGSSRSTMYFDCCLSV